MKSFKFFVFSNREKGFGFPFDRPSKDSLERMDTRIIGGEVSDLGNWPWQAAMLYAKYGSHIICAGTIVTKKVVIGAAHCVGNFETNLLTFSAGHTEESYQSSPVKRAVPHPDFNNFFHNDIALFELEKPFTWTEFVKPACLPYSDFVPSDSGRCVVSGFGKGSNDRLTHVVLPLWEKASCKSILESQGGATWTGLPLDESQFCAGYQPGGLDACQGDSGGPFVCKTNQGWVATGAVSYGYGCAEKNMPAVYANIPLYRDWMLAFIGESNDEIPDGCGEPVNKASFGDSILAPTLLDVENGNLWEGEEHRFVQEYKN
ncbi:Oidioi.mRNA.OKI2018_I69.chr1.g872.t1.cds [Oikopleura dioica]|uniref:Oidioi.mRNA.OKI2018_I69.chr1.g872.t1.cds n=1 Tax=Oikopleura dioica TaxID=34765 RepID=A0ABN7SR84_OIKDI|nr:Oidioi.mRNA.OKI2018_I69.chr1.g872.t1.cds [Oikopleura dioica]